MVREAKHPRSRRIPTLAPHSRLRNALRQRPQLSNCLVPVSCFWWIAAHSGHSPCAPRNDAPSAIPIAIPIPSQIAMCPARTPATAPRAAPNAMPNPVCFDLFIAPLQFPNRLVETGPHGTGSCGDGRIRPSRRAQRGAPSATSPCRPPAPSRSYLQAAALSPAGPPAACPKVFRTTPAPAPPSW